MKKFTNSEIFSFSRRIFRRVVEYIISGLNRFIICYNQPDRIRVLYLMREIKRERELLLDHNEAYQIFMVVKRTEKIKGDIGEVGVYKGGSAKLICEAKRNRPLHLFDTFEGLPEVEEIDTLFYKGQYNASFEDVKNYLKKYPNVHFYKGVFPKSAESVKNKLFSFLNLDVDTYRSTLDCLKFFYHRMSKGGIIMSHDYMQSSGVKKAFDEFFKNKPEPIIELAGTQCLVVKI